MHIRTQAEEHTFMNESMITKQIMISPDHPSLAGHFPGNPVVPGVVILEYVRQCIEEWKHSSIKASSLKSVKFLSPVMMNDSQQQLDIVLNEVKAAIDSQAMGIDFCCSSNDKLVVRGFWLLQTTMPQ